MTSASSDDDTGLLHGSRRHSSNAPSNMRSSAVTEDPKMVHDTPLRRSLKTLIRSKAYFGYFVVVAIVTCLLLVWLLFSGFHPSGVLFVVLDFIVCMSFGVDVLMRIYIETPTAYFDCASASGNQRVKVLWNWFDCCVVWLSGLSFCLYVVSAHNTYEEKIDATVEIVLISFRALTSVLRLWGVLKSTGMSFRRATSTNPYMNLNEDEGDFTLSEVIEKQGTQTAMDDTSSLSEDDLFARPSVGNNEAPKQKSPSMPQQQQGTFSSMASRLGNAMGLNEEDVSDDSDDSGLDEDELLSRPQTTTGMTESRMTSGSEQVSEDMFESCIDDPSIQKKVEKAD